MKKLILPAVFMAFIAAPMAYSMPTVMCGKKQVKIGDQINVVKAACGNPRWVKTKGSQRIQYHYLDQTNKTAFEFEFKGGKLKEIELEHVN